MKIVVLSYLVSGVAFLGLDAVWLSIMGTPLYRAHLGSLMLEKFLYPPAIAFYLAYPVGIAVFAVGPGLQSASGAVTFAYGLLFGFLAYATYNLTNMATVRGWSAIVTVVDTGWGAAVTGAAAIAGYWVVRILDKA